MHRQEWRFIPLDALPYPQSTAFVSSGSTGTPKSVRKTEVDRMGNIDKQALRMGKMTSATRYLSSLSVAMGWAMLGRCWQGGVIILSDDRDKLLQYIDLYQVNNMVITPAILSRMIEVEQARATGCSSSAGLKTSSISAAIRFLLRRSKPRLKGLCPQGWLPILRFLARRG
ncbi:MAG: AMP-binding protein [Rhodobacteraceae bacterium]|nr:AMP-binding protein [Paracoccaceae bacterium]